jgi:antitoxin ParD1/3/4
MRPDADLPKVCQANQACAMRTMNICLPDTLKSFVDEQVSQRVYGTRRARGCRLLRRPA